jgi:signal transduction histidine kinase/ActR/RegA family two-component response regulator
MTLLLDIAPYIPPASPQATGGEIYQRFQAEPDTLAIAVVDSEGLPLGLIERNAFLVQMAAQYGYALWAKRSVSNLMKTDPVIADGDVTVAEFCGQILEEAPSELLHGFIVTCGGRYAGVGTALALLQATGAAASAHAQEMSRLAQETQEALAAKGRFLAVMSHEIRTPLNGVLAVAEILRRKAKSAELAPLVDTILESGGVLLRLLNDALDLSRAEASGLALDEGPVAISALLDDATGMWAAQAELKGLAFEARYEGPAGVWALADAGRLRQVLNNLVGNAVKFTEAGRVDVRVGCVVEEGYVRLWGEVTDTGPGMPEARLADIFEPFHQTEQGLRQGGAGLGLAVCRQIVERMNGTISADLCEGGGARFRFEVPLHRLPEPAEAAPAEVGDELTTRTLHVLIADDNETNRMVARTLCEMFGCTSECVEDGAQAVTAAATGQFDLILMDVKMPVMDGVEATRRIRSRSDAVSQTPILALTANADPADAAFYRRCGMNGVVEKPVKPERLLAAMNAVVALAEAA